MIPWYYLYLSSACVHQSLIACCLGIFYKRNERPLGIRVLWDAHKGFHILSVCILREFPSWALWVLSLSFLLSLQIGTFLCHFSSCCHNFKLRTNYRNLSLKTNLLQFMIIIFHGWRQNTFISFDFILLIFVFSVSYTSPLFVFLFLTLLMGSSFFGLLFRIYLSYIFGLQVNKRRSFL